MVERAHPTDALALAAQPREREYAIHDETLRGFMLRVQPGGSRSWVQRQHARPAACHPETRLAAPADDVAGVSPHSSRRVRP